MASYDITVIWDPNTEPDFDFYRIYRGLVSGGPYELIGQTKSNAFIDKDIPEGNTLYYVLRAIDKQGNQSGYSSEIIKTSPPDVTPPAAPTNLRARGLDDWSGVELFWYGSGIQDVKGYIIYRTYDGLSYDIIATTTKPYYKDTNIPLGIDPTYACTFVAYYVASYDKYFNQSVALGPTGTFIIPLLQKPRASIDYLSLNIIWAEPRPEDGVTSVTVWYKKKTDVAWVNAGTADYPTSKFRIDGPLLENTEYDVALTVNATIYKQVNWLRVVMPLYESDTIPPTSPDLFIARADPDNDRVFLTWRRLAIDDDFLHYQIYVALSGQPIKIVGKTSDNNFTLNNAHAYVGDSSLIHFQIKAVDRARNLSSATITTTVPWYDVLFSGGNEYLPGWITPSQQKIKGNNYYASNISVSLTWNDNARESPGFKSYVLLNRVAAKSQVPRNMFSAWTRDMIIKETASSNQLTLYINQPPYAAGAYTDSNYFMIGVLDKYGYIHFSTLGTVAIEVPPIDTTLT